MRTTLLFILFLFSSILMSSAQQFDWVNNRTIPFQSNPSMLLHSCTSDPQGNVYFLKGDSLTQLYGSDLFARLEFEKRSSNGNLLFSNTLNGKILCNHLVADASGNSYLAGQYMETILLSPADSLVNRSGNFNIDLFAVSFDPNGLIRWKTNLSLQFPNDVEMDAICLGPNGNPWIAIRDFSTSTLLELDAANGQVINQRTLDGLRMIGSMSFDAQGGLYVAGSTGNGTVTFGGQSFTANDIYNLFLLRYLPNGQAGWANFMHDVTFQQPQIQASHDGAVFFCTPLLDSISFGNFHLNQPQWVYDFALAKCDSTGQFLWAYQPVKPVSIQGDVSPGSHHFMTIDANDNIFLTMQQRGFIDWGNNVQSSSGAISISTNTFICFNSHGQAQWALTADAGKGNVFVNAITSGPNNSLYFIDAIRDTVSFGNHLLQTGGTFIQGVAAGKITYPNTTSGLENTSGEPALTVWPNPAHDIIHLNQAFHQAAFEIRSTTGQLVRTGYLNGEEIRIPGLSGGAYQLIIKEKDRRLSRGFIVLP